MNQIPMNIFDTDTLESVEAETIDTVEVVLPAKCVLFNDEWHTFDEVITQIIKATGCSYSKAERHTLEVHNSGKSIVYNGELGRCLEVSSVLEEIALHTKVEF